MSTNLVFVFAAYMEYAVVTVLSRQYKKTISGRRPKTSSTAKVNIGCLLLLLLVVGLLLLFWGVGDFCLVVVVLLCLRVI